LTTSHPKSSWRFGDHCRSPVDASSGYQKEIPKAYERLDEAVRTGKRVRLYQTEGVARIKIKTIEEMAVDKAEARANAFAADKGKMTGSAPKSH